MVDTTARDPRGTGPLHLELRRAFFVALTEQKIALKSRRDVARAAYKRLGLDLKTIGKDGNIADRPPAKVPGKVAATKPVVAKGKGKPKKAAAPKRAPIRTKPPVPALSRGVASPKSSLTANGKKRGRPFGSSNKKAVLTHEPSQGMTNGQHEDIQPMPIPPVMIETSIPRED